MDTSRIEKSITYTVYVLMWKRPQYPLVAVYLSEEDAWDAAGRIGGGDIDRFTVESTELHDLGDERTP